MDHRRLALLSVSDKTGIEALGRGLVETGFEILSTGGTARALESAGVPVEPVSGYTGAPEILDGRVKTLHPRIHGGILARDTEEHRADLARIGGELIDVVAVNLYPFESEVASEEAGLSDAVEQIDIGGPTLVRAAAKNFERVVAICDPADYERVLGYLREDGEVPLPVRFELSNKAFGHTAAYDAAIARALPTFDPSSGARRGGAR